MSSGFSVDPGVLLAGALLLVGVVASGLAQRFRIPSLPLGFSVNRIFGWFLAPVAWMMGIEGWHDCQIFGSLLGTKVAVNEFIAFNDLASYVPTSESERKFVSERSVTLATYALCGFANFASIGIQIGGISPLAPERKTEISRLAVKAMLGGAFASWMTATMAGMLL